MKVVDGTLSTWIMKYGQDIRHISEQHLVASGHTYKELHQQKDADDCFDKQTPRATSHPSREGRLGKSIVAWIATIKRRVHTKD